LRSAISEYSRRDNYFTSDWFGFYVDPFNDKKTGNFFGINAAGTMVDGVLFNDSWDDSSWDGVWEGKTTINGEGWSLEMRIPFSQLRFKESDKMVWGINFNREIKRRLKWFSTFQSFNGALAFFGLWFYHHNLAVAPFFT